MKTLILLLASLLFSSSCMHLGMMGTGTDHQSTPESVLEKEVTVGGIRAIAIFPPLERGKEALFTLRLSDAETGQAISRAQVFFHAEYLHTIDRHAMHGKDMMHHEMDSTKPQRMEQEHDVNLDQEVTESSIRGTYSVRFNPSQSGEHKLMFHITALGDQMLEPEIVIEATRIVPDKASGHSGGMHGMGTPTTLVIVGAAIMGAMMLAGWIIRGRIF